MLFLVLSILLCGCKNGDDQNRGKIVTKRFTEEAIYPRFLRHYLRQNKEISCEEMCKWNFANDGQNTQISFCELDLDKDKIDRVGTAKEDEELGKISCTAHVIYR